MPALYTIVLVGFTALLIAAAYSDLRRFEIPNTIPLALVAFYPALAVTAQDPVDPMAALFVAAAALLVGAGLFMVGLLGGGDVKLFAAAALWVGPARFPDFLVCTSLVGGLLALTLLSRPGAAFIGRFQTVSTDPVVPALKRPMPYGIAIAVAGIVTALHPLLNEAAPHAQP